MSGEDVPEDPGYSGPGPAEETPGTETFDAETPGTGDAGAEVELIGDVDDEETGGDPLAALGMEGGIDFGAMMAMAQDMSERVGTAQAELAEARIEGTAGGGLVKLVLNGHLHLLSVEIDPAAADPDDHSVVGDLVVAAWRDAHEEVARMQAAADPLGGLGGALGDGEGGGGLAGGLGGLLGGG